MKKVPLLYEKNWDLSFLTCFIETFKMFVQIAVKILYFQLSLCLVKAKYSTATSRFSA